MLFLFITSLIWAFSFGLIKDGLAGLPSSVITLIRLVIALAVFAPFMRPARLRLPDTLRLMIIGAVQYGLMYLFYIEAFRYLKAYEIALFTVFTPFYVTAVNDLFNRKINLAALGACILAVAGGAVMEYRDITSSDLLTGFLLMQASNLCFAFGQIFYCRVMAGLPEKKSNLQVFGLLYLGAALVAAAAAAPALRSSVSITFRQAGILLYLGAVAAGLGFFLWNAGARNVRPGTLAVFNNLKIPLGVLVSVLFFKESADWPRLLGGGSLMLLALAVNEYFKNGRSGSALTNPPGSVKP